MSLGEGLGLPTRSPSMTVSDPPLWGEFQSGRDMGIRAPETLAFARARQPWKRYEKLHERCV